LYFGKPLWPCDSETTGIVERSRENAGKVENPPGSLDLRFGNTCNLSCRSCQPMSSSKLATEWLILEQRDGDVFKEFSKNAEWSDKALIADWGSDERFLAEFDKILSGIKIIYITGGEPTLIRGYRWKSC